MVQLKKERSMQQEWKSAYMKAQLDVMSVQRKVKKVCSVLSSSDKAMCQTLYKVGDTRRSELPNFVVVQKSDFG